SMFWEIMDRFEQQARAQVRLTYRAVGTANGQADFVAEETEYRTMVHFAAGELPLDAQYHSELDLAGQSVLQFPFALSTVGVYTTLRDSNVSLDSCDLANIFS